MIQKKICMVGTSAVGKTSLVRRFVESIFSDRYLSTVGVKIDRKAVEVGGQPVNLMLWDLEGKTNHENLRLSYVRGAAGVLYVADGTRRDTYDDLFRLREQVDEEIGRVPSIVALNKHDLLDDWQIGADDQARLTDEGWLSFLTSAKTGAGVDRAFEQLAAATLKESA